MYLQWLTHLHRQNMRICLGYSITQLLFSYIKSTQKSNGSSKHFDLWILLKYPLFIPPTLEETIFSGLCLSVKTITQNRKDLDWWNLLCGLWIRALVCGLQSCRSLRFWTKSVNEKSFRVHLNTTSQSTVEMLFDT